MPVPKYQPLTLAPINFSLTEGTSIPAPPDSPPDTPRPPTPGKGPLSSHPTPKSAVFPQHRDAKNSVDSAADSTLDRTTTNEGNGSLLSPASPTSTRRPSSVRKFLGLRSLPSSESLKSERPGSPATVASQPSLARKKSSSWFGSRRKSTFNMAGLPEGKETKTSNANGLGGQHAKPAAPPPEKKGPPPPALPALQSFGVSEDSVSLGAEDMFKNIK